MSLSSTCDYTTERNSPKNCSWGSYRSLSLLKPQLRPVGELNSFFRIELHCLVSVCLEEWAAAADYCLVFTTGLNCCPRRSSSPPKNYCWPGPLHSYPNNFSTIAAGWWARGEIELLLKVGCKNCMSIVGLCGGVCSVGSLKIIILCLSLLNVEVTSVCQHIVHPQALPEPWSVCRGEETARV